MPPQDVNIESGEQQGTISYIIEATADVIAGEEDVILAYAQSGSISKKSSIQMLVVSSGGIQKATYDVELGTPRCFAEGSEVRKYEDLHHVECVELTEFALSLFVHLVHIWQPPQRPR